MSKYISNPCKAFVFTSNSFIILGCSSPKYANIFFWSFFVKIAPDLTEEEVVSIAECLINNNIDAVISTNTTLSRDGVENLLYGSEQGGLSGQPVKDKSTQVIKLLANALDNKLPIIGVGGISNAKDAAEKLDAGAKLVQVYTGFIYQGPDLVKDIVTSL